MPEKITKRTVEGIEPRASRYTIFDSVIPGFGLRVYPTGQASWIFEYRAGEGGRRAAVRRITIGLARDAEGKRNPDFTADGARKAAEKLRAMVIGGGDPASDKAKHREAPTVKEVAEAFLRDHVAIKRKPGTYAHYADVLSRIVIPEIGTMKAKDVKRADVVKLHLAWKHTPFQANRVMAVLGSMYAYARGDAALVGDDVNPVRGVGKFQEAARGRLLSTEELERLGASIREAETVGLPWHIDETKKVKHVPKLKRETAIGPHAAGALRLLILTGARLREILNLKWSSVDVDRGLLILADHKASRTAGAKTIVLNAPALEVLTSLPRIGQYVIAGDSAGQPDERPRSDLKRPWTAVRRHAGLEDLRIHDLRHNFASFGAGGGMGLPIIGKLLGHAQATTTARYSHLDNDPLRRASNTIGSAISAAMGDTKPADNVVPIRNDKSAS